MEGWWDCEKLDEFFYKVLKADLDKKIKWRRFLGDVLKAKLINLQSKSRAFEVGEKHYDIGNELGGYFYFGWLFYSCVKF